MSAHYVYMAYASSGRALYVGMTKNPGLRLAQHARKSEWFDQAVHFTIVRHDTKAEAVEDEGHSVRLLRPIHNVNLQGEPKPRQIRYNQPLVPLSALRHVARITSSEAAARAGLTSTRYSNIENNHGPAPSDAEMAAIAAGFGLASGRLTPQVSA